MSGTCALRVEGKHQVSGCRGLKGPDLRWAAMGLWLGHPGADPPIEVTSIPQCFRSMPLRFKVLCVFILSRCARGTGKRLPAHAVSPSPCWWLRGDPTGAGGEGDIPTSAQAASSATLLLGRDAPGTASHPAGFVVAEPDPNVGYYL